jgi:branched-chain amino acid transport system substrate-binding protein
MAVTRRTFLGSAAAGGAITMIGERSWLGRAWAQPGEPFRVGVLTPLTGGGAVYGTAMSKMYGLLAEEINKSTAAGAAGINGKPIQLFVEDDQTNPDAGVRGARKLVDVNKVHAIVGTWSSAVTLAVAPICVQAKIPLFCVSSSPAITTFKDDDFLYRTSTSQAFWSGVFFLAGRKLNARSAGIMILNNPYGLGLGDTFAERFTKAGGKVTGRVVYNPSQPSYRSEIQQALGGKPDVILFAGYTPDGIQIFKEWFQLGLGGTWMGPGFAFNPQFIQAIGAQAAEGTVVVEAAPRTDSSAWKDAQKLYRGATGQDADIFVSMAYDHLLILAMAVLAAKGDTAGEAIKAQIRKVSNPPGKIVGTWAEAAPPIKAGEKVNYEGASGACDFDEAGDVFTDFGLYRVKGGKWVIEQTITSADVRAL